MEGLEVWFQKNKTRKVCVTDMFNVRRGYIIRDVLGHTDLKSNDKYYEGVNDGIRKAYEGLGLMPTFEVMEKALKELSKESKIRNNNNE